MKLIRRYIRQHVFYGIVGALLVLVSLYAFSLFISEIDKVGRGSYDLSSAALYVLLTLPRRFPVVTDLKGPKMKDMAE